MLVLNANSHKLFLEENLRGFINKGTLAFYVWKTIGETLHSRLVEELGGDETEFSDRFPIDLLYSWVTTGQGLVPESLLTEDGRYRDAHEKPIPLSVTPTFTDVEQLAAYGLWLITELINDIPGEEESILTAEDILQHKTECLLLAYDALWFAETAMLGTHESAERIKRVSRLNFSKIGKIGAAKRHAPMAELKRWVLQHYHEGNWSSANKAAHALKDEAILHGRSIGAVLSEENAQKTIANWIAKARAGR